MNVLSMKKPTATVSPWRAVLSANLQAVRETRAKLDVVAAKDRTAAADVALADATAARIQTVRDEIDRARADAAYSGEAPPDLTKQEKQLQDAQQLYKNQADSTRVAQHVRAKYSAEIAALHDTIRTHSKETTRLLWNCLREDELAGLAGEFLAAEAAFRNVHQRAFAAALAVDQISLSQSYGQFVGSADVADIHISRPDHPAFTPVPLTPEQAHDARRKYATDVADGAKALLDKLLNGDEQ
jgi:hypothetical protein